MPTENHNPPSTMTQSTNSGSLRPIDQTLHDACSALDEPKVLAALDAGADPNALDDDTSPILATLHGSDFMSTFHEWAGLSPLSDDDDETVDDQPVDKAKADAFDREADRRRIRIFFLLLSRGADINQDLGEVELLWYAVHHSPEVLEFLLAHGADPNRRASGNNDPLDYAMTPLCHAWTDESAYRNDPDLAPKLANNASILLAYGALPDWPDTFEETAIDPAEIRDFDNVPPLVYPALPEAPEPLSEADHELFAACDALDAVAIEKALACGANPNARDPDDNYRTPLLAIVDASNEEDSPESDSVFHAKMLRMTKHLLAAGADSNLPQVEKTRENGREYLDGSTPLQHAAWINKDVELCECLLRHGANPNFVCSTPGGEEATIMSMNNWDYNVDDPLIVKPVEQLLARHGGCCTYIFEPDSCDGMRDVDTALVCACQRMNFSASQLAVHLGADRSLRHLDRSLPVVALQDAPQLCGKRFADHGWPLEDELRDFLFFLLVGLKAPLDLPEAAKILRAAVDNGHETVLRGLVSHHSLGPLFRQAAATLDTTGFPWTCWPAEKQTALRQALGIAP